jgi:putative ABC transport system permease protein
MTALLIALRDMGADRRRSLLSLVALAPIVAAFLVLMGVAAGLRGQSFDPSEQNILLLSPNSLDPASGRLDPGVLDLVDTVGGADVASAGPVIFRPMKVGEAIVQLRAAALREWEQVHGLALLDGSWPEPGSDQIAVTEGVAAATGWNVGSTADIYGTTFTVGALVRAPGTKFASVWMSYRRADRLFEGATGFQMVVVRPSAGADAVALRDRLAAEANGRYSAYFESEAAAEQSSRLGVADELAAAATLVGSAALAFGSFNLTALTLAERRRDLGIARSLGFSPRAIAAVAVLRAVVLALGAALLGSIVAAVFVGLVGTTTLRSFVIEVAVPAAAWPAAAAMCTLAAGAGAWLAQRPSSRRPIRDLLEEP